MTATSSPTAHHQYKTDNSSNDLPTHYCSALSVSRLRTTSPRSGYSTTNATSQSLFYPFQQAPMTALAPLSLLSLQPCPLCRCCRCHLLLPLLWLQLPLLRWEKCIVAADSLRWAMMLSLQRPGKGCLRPDDGPEEKIDDYEHFYCCCLVRENGKEAPSSTTGVDSGSPPSTTPTSLSCPPRSLDTSSPDLLLQQRCILQHAQGHLISHYHPTLSPISLQRPLHSWGSAADTILSSLRCCSYLSTTVSLASPPTLLLQLLLLLPLLSYSSLSGPAPLLSLTGSHKLEAEIAEGDARTSRDDGDILGMTRHKAANSCPERGRSGWRSC